MNSCYNRVMPNLYNQTVKEIVQDFEVDPKTGLTAQEVEKRRVEYGKIA